jgi:hypothetical protein
MVAWYQKSKSRRCSCLYAYLFAHACGKKEVEQKTGSDSHKVKFLCSHVVMIVLTKVCYFQNGKFGHLQKFYDDENLLIYSMLITNDDLKKSI